MTQQLLAVCCGGVVGFSLALTGGGGSTLAIPLLLYVVGLQNMHLAIGTSALAVSLNSYANLIPHARAGHVHWRPGIIFTMAGVVGALIGSEFGKLVDGQLLAAMFAVLVFVVAVLMLRSGKAGQAGAASGPVDHATLRLTVIGLATGGVAGLFGVGGGFLCVPGLMLAARMNILNAIGTSLLGVGSFGLATALNYARSGLIDWPIAAEFIVGGVIGGWLGVITARHLSAKRGALNVVFSAMLIGVAAYMLYQTLPSLLGAASR